MCEKPTIVKRLVELMEGTSLTIRQACKHIGTKEDVLTEEQRTGLMDSIFNCDGCGRWFDVDERNDSDEGDVCDVCEEGE